MWHHADFYPDAAVHTIVCRAARASDLDESCAAAHGAFEVGALAEVRAVAERMDVALADVGGAEWAEKWHVGLPSWFESTTGSFYTQTVWLYNVIKAYGMLDFAKVSSAGQQGSGRLDGWNLRRGIFLLLEHHLILTLSPLLCRSAIQHSKAMSPS